VGDIENNEREEIMKLLYAMIIGATIMVGAYSMKTEKLNEEFDVRTWTDGTNTFAQIYRNNEPCGCKHVITVNPIHIVAKQNGKDKCSITYDNGRKADLIITGNTITVVDYIDGKPDYTGELNK
jgi:hypothetical protein